MHNIASFLFQLALKTSSSSETFDVIQNFHFVRLQSIIYWLQSERNVFFWIVWQNIFQLHTSKRAFQIRFLSTWKNGLKLFFKKFNMESKMPLIWNNILANVLSILTSSTKHGGLD